MSKKKFKRDYIILEAKDANFRYKERVLPKAFAKVEVNDEKSIIALYVENLKYMKDGYRVVAIQSDYETIDLGKITLSEQGKGEFILDLGDNESDIKGVAVLYEKIVPLIGFKGNKIENYEEILFAGDRDEYLEAKVDDDDNLDDDIYEEYDGYEEYDDNDNDDGYEYEYIEIDDDGLDNDYEEIEYIDVDDDSDDSDDYDGYEEIDNYEDIDKYEDYEKIIPSKKRVESLQEKEAEKVLKQKPRQQQYKAYNQSQSKQEETKKSAGTLLMPRQIKKGLKYFKEVKPFVCDYIEDTRWWNIEINPNTICGYTMPYLGYVNTLNYTMYSDAIIHSYKYRHYLFGVQYDEYNKRKNYIYAVPGNKDEQPDKGYTGFSVYQPCDNRNDSLGYWLCFIDSRTRRIIK